MINAAIIGATGYSGVELIRLLHAHPHVKVKRLLSRSTDETRFSQVHPHMGGLVEQPLENLDSAELSEDADVLFFATPSGISSQYIPALMESGIPIIDLSGDFRLHDASAYSGWYNYTHPAPQCLSHAVYGLTEENALPISEAQLIANPGCYPTAALLALLPGHKAGWYVRDSAIIDGKSGVSGAGRGLSAAAHFSEVNESIRGYKLGRHQHVPEIEQELGAGVVFTPHLIPITRGLMCTVYVRLAEPKTTEEVIAYHRQYYSGKPFVRVRDAGQWPATKQVLGSNFCDLGFHADPDRQVLTIVSVIDNLVKGAAGQAVQNMNVRFGWPEDTGLQLVPLCP